MTLVAGLFAIGLLAASVSWAGGNTRGSGTSSNSLPIGPSAPPNLSADFTFSPTKPVIGETVTFLGTATGGTPPYAYYNWTFGDGFTGSGATVTHAYAFGATFPVTLNVTDSAAASDLVMKSVVVNSLLTADFTFTPAKPQAGEVISFTATASGGFTPYTFAWTFGDGATGSGATVTHVYASGTFSAGLTATDSGGHRVTAIKSVFVTAALTAGFSFTPLKPQVGEAVTFSATASGGTSPYTYAWTFGDASSGSGATVTHTYTSPGTFTVTLTLSDSASHISTTSKPLVVTVALTASFTFAPGKPQVGQVVSFSGTQTGGTSPYTYAWTFGDGSSGSGATVTHTYTSQGAFTVTLTVSDSAGHVDPATNTVAVSPALTTDFTFSPPQPVAGELVAFSATASGGTSPYTYAWDFGDTKSGSGATVTHAYTAAGTFTVTLTVSDSAGHTATVSKSIVVSSVLAASFTLTPAKPQAGEVVTFSATASGGTSPYTYAWTFGDGLSGSGATVTHTYTSPGTFTVTLTVSDSAGHTATAPKSVVVTAALAADFSFSPTNPLVGTAVTFSATASGGTSPYTYAWTFGDGLSGSGATVTHTYTSPGTFTVTLTVSDSAGHVVTVSKPIVVGTALAADFAFAPTRPVVRETVSFAATASGGVPPYSYAWVFGDGGVGTGAVTTHSYASTGTFAVTLTVSDSASHTTPVTKSVPVSPTLTADFTFSPVKPAVRDSVTFSATGSGGTSPYTYSWVFGDGSTGSGATLSHVYATAGTFSVTLTFSDSAGHSTSVTKSVAVSPALTADFTFSPAKPLVGDAVSFTATASGGTSPYAYAWTFGDGSTGSGSPVIHSYANAKTFAVTLNVSDSAGHWVLVPKSIVVSPPVVASFTFAPAKPEVSELVSFSGSATGGTPPYTYNWAFGDGSTGSGATTSHAYASAGTFNVTLTVSDSAAHLGSASHLVVVSSLLTFDFSYSPTKPALGEVVSFSASASGGTPPYTYAWNFGDGSTGSGATTSHAYTATGTFTVMVSVTDSAGHVVAVGKSITVTPPLTASFSFAPTIPQILESVSFSAAASGGTSPYSFVWTFGDGSGGSGPTVSHAYSTAGTFTVTLTVSDSAGHGATVSKSVFVSAPLTADFDFTPPDPLPGETLHFTANSSGGTSPYSFAWNFGDGGSAVGGTVSHWYAAVGTYLVTLACTDTAGHLVNVAKSISVSTNLSASFTFSPLGPMIGQAISFSATAKGGSPTYAFVWTFGDGSGGTGANINHTYVATGSFVITLNVTDSGGHNVTRSKTAAVSPLLVADFAFTPEHPVQHETVSFSGNASGGVAPYTFAWTFGEGGTRDTADVTYAYSLVGPFSVTLNVSDSAGHFLTITRPIVVAQILAVNFTFAFGALSSETTVSFTPIVTGGTGPYTYDWTFGDGATSHEAGPSHHFAGSGFTATYTVALVVCDSASHCASSFRDITVWNFLLMIYVAGGASIAIIVTLWAVRRFFVRKRPLMGRRFRGGPGV